MNNRINIEEVRKQLREIDNYINRLDVLCPNIESDISSGWDSDTAKLVSARIKDIKDNITVMRNKINAVRARAEDFANMYEVIDTSKA